MDYSVSYTFVAIWHTFLPDNYKASSVNAYFLPVNKLYRVALITVYMYTAHWGPPVPLLDNIFSVQTKVYTRPLFLPSEDPNNELVMFMFFYTHPHPQIMNNKSITDIWEDEFRGEILIFHLDNTHQKFVNVNISDDAVGHLVDEFMPLKVIRQKYLSFCY